MVPGQNALVLETADPWEFVVLFRELRANPVRDRALRRAGRTTAEQYSWSHVVRRVLFPRLHVVAEHLRGWLEGMQLDQSPIARFFVLH